MINLQMKQGAQNCCYLQSILKIDNILLTKRKLTILELHLLHPKLMKFSCSMQHTWHHFSISSCWKCSKISIVIKCMYNNIIELLVYILSRACCAWGWLPITNLGLVLKGEIICPYPRIIHRQLNYRALPLTMDSANVSKLTWFLTNNGLSNPRKE